MSLIQIKSIIDKAKGKREVAEDSLFKLKKSKKLLIKDIKHSEKALAIIQEVAKDTQSQLEYRISDIVSMALSAIFDDPYTFKIEFVLKRNKTECVLLLERGGKVISPLSAGGGVMDVTAFALRIALWAIQTPRSRNTIILDEPFKFLSKDLLPRASDLLKELSTKLNLQFIIVTHLSELTDCADRILKVSIRKGKSKVKKV